MSAFRGSHCPLDKLLPHVFILTGAAFVFLQSNKMLSTQLAAVETEKAELLQSLSAVEAELTAQGEELQRVQSHLATERENRVKTAEALQNQLNEKVPESSTVTSVNVLTFTFKGICLHRRRFHCS